MGHHDVETRPHRTRATAPACAPILFQKWDFIQHHCSIVHAQKDKSIVLSTSRNAMGLRGFMQTPPRKNRRAVERSRPESINRTRHEIVMDTVGSDESFARAPAAGPGRATHACAGGQRVTGRAVSATNRNVHIRGPGRTRNAHNSHIFLTQEEEPGAPEWNRNSPIRTATASDVQAHTSSSNSKVSKILVVQLVIIIKLILL